MGALSLLHPWHGDDCVICQEQRALMRLLVAEVLAEEDATRATPLLDTCSPGDDTAPITTEEVPNAAC
jgi:hypothetical protein